MIDVLSFLVFGLLLLAHTRPDRVFHATLGALVLAWVCTIAHCLWPTPALRLTNLVPFAQCSIGVGLLWTWLLDRSHPSWDLLKRSVPIWLTAQAFIVVAGILSPAPQTPELTWNLWLPVHVLVAAATTAGLIWLAGLVAQRSRKMAWDVSAVMVAGICLSLLAARLGPQAGFRMPVTSLLQWPDAVRLAVDVVDSRSGESMQTISAPFHLIYPWLSPCLATLLAVCVLSLLDRAGRRLIQGAMWLCEALALGLLITQSMEALPALLPAHTQAFASAMVMNAQVERAVVGASWTFPSGPYSLWTPALLTAVAWLAALWLSHTSWWFCKSAASHAEAQESASSAAVTELLPTVATLMSFTFVSGALWAMRDWGRLFAFDLKESLGLAALALFLAAVAAPQRLRPHIVALLSALFLLSWLVLTDAFPGLHRYGIY